MLDESIRFNGNGKKIDFNEGTSYRKAKKQFKELKSIFDKIDEVGEKKGKVDGRELELLEMLRKQFPEYVGEEDMLKFVEKFEQSDLSIEEFLEQETEKLKKKAEEDAPKPAESPVTDEPPKAKTPETPAAPVEPEKPAEPAKPIESEKPTEPEKPAEPEKAEEAKTSNSKLSPERQARRKAFNDAIQNLKNKMEKDKDKLVSEFDKEYTVKAGDSFYRIAERSLMEENGGKKPTPAEINRRIAEIALVNGIDDIWMTIRPGDKLKLKGIGEKTENKPAAEGDKPSVDGGETKPGDKPPVDGGETKPGDKPPVDGGETKPGDKPPVDGKPPVEGKPPVDGEETKPGDNPPVSKRPSKTEKKFYEEGVYHGKQMAETLNTGFGEIAAMLRSEGEYKDFVSKDNILGVIAGFKAVRGTGILEAIAGRYFFDSGKRPGQALCNRIPKALMRKAAGLNLQDTDAYKALKDYFDADDNFNFTKNDDAKAVYSKREAKQVDKMVQDLYEVVLKKVNEKLSDTKPADKPPVKKEKVQPPFIGEDYNKGVSHGKEMAAKFKNGDYATVVEMLRGEKAEYKGFITKDNVFGVTKGFGPGMMASLVSKSGVLVDKEIPTAEECNKIPKMLLAKAKEMGLENKETYKQLEAFINRGDFSNELDFNDTMKDKVSTKPNEKYYTPEQAKQLDKLIANLMDTIMFP